MSRGLSLYLDLLRFFMATVVVTGHSTFRGYTGHPFQLWFSFPYMQTAVIGFFVLSGFVIAHVTETKEKSAAIYAASRIARLYSVVIPALLLTVLCDTIGEHLDPPFYATGPVALADQQPARYLASFFMINHFWIMPTGMAPGTNGPFWSLSYEIAYYLVFGMFLTRNWIVMALGTLAVSAAAGPGIMMLFPLWLLGVAIYHLQKSWALPRAFALLLFLATPIALAEIGWLRGGWNYDTGRPLHIDYAEAGLIALNILAAARLGQVLERLLARFAPLIRWLGTLTFATYLCHRPLLQFLSTWRIAEPGAPLQHLWLFGGTFVVIAVVAHIGEKLRVNIRGALISRLATRPGTYAQSG